MEITKNRSNFWCWFIAIFAGILLFLLFLYFSFLDMEKSEDTEQKQVGQYSVIYNDWILNLTGLSATRNVISFSKKYWEENKYTSQTVYYEYILFSTGEEITLLIWYYDQRGYFRASVKKVRVAHFL